MQVRELLMGALRASVLMSLGLSQVCLAQQLKVSINADGSYTIGSSAVQKPVLTSGIAAQIDGRWVHAADYPHHSMVSTTVEGPLGNATQWRVIWSGLANMPDLAYEIRVYSGPPAMDVRAIVINSTAAAHHVSAIRSIEAPSINLGGPVAQDRVLSDSSSEDRPAMVIRDLADAPEQLHRAVGSQLVYNRQSQESLFVGTLTSEKFLSILRIHVANTSITAFEAESAGTTEIQKIETLRDAPEADRIDLDLPVEPGQQLAAEPLLIRVGDDYHQQLEDYGALMRKMHAARTQAPPLMGWWSWTAYYYGLNEGTALTNAEWQAEHLKSFGYNLFHIDESYQFARGEYSTPNATLFPQGIANLENKVRALGLTPGIWTAPFEVSDRSWVYQNHPDWLVKNREGRPLQVGTVKSDHLFVLDTTNPGAQEYLRQTYTILVHDWGIRYFKMDFMDDTAVEGVYYRPNTTALEAERIGLKIIRDTVGEDVLLDKDGSPMLNAVGFVDYGRISQDTGHTFEASRDAATGIAARYYMNRNYFVSDPDAFSISRQTIDDQPFHGKVPLTLDEARVSLALAAVSGGMLEIGDTLPAFQNDPERLALMENQDVLNMVRLGRASVPVDLMDYESEARQPSIFLLKETPRQSILAVFNWTEDAHNYSIAVSRLGLKPEDHYMVTEVFDARQLDIPSGAAWKLNLPAHSVRMLKIVDASLPEDSLAVKFESPAGESGQTLSLSAVCSGSEPPLSFTWSFGDGVSLEGQAIQHTWVSPGDYPVHLQVKGLSGHVAEADGTVRVTGRMPTVFLPAENRRYTGN